MNIAKNMEIIFVTAVVLATAASFATASVPAFSSQQAAVTAAVQGPMQVVTISAKRLTAAEKAALI